MKNLLVYLNPNKNFDSEYSRYVKIQIDNSLLYTKPEDIIIATNFPYEYHGIKALVVADNMILDFDKKACKVNVIVDFIEKGILQEPCWYHDFEAFQTSPFDLKLTKNLALTDYGWKPKWNTGSFFFTPKVIDIFKALQEEIYMKEANEEPILWTLWKENAKDIQSRSQSLNITYNLGMRHIADNLARADKPVKVMHFHPYRHNLLQQFVPLLPPRLYSLISKYDLNESR